MTFLAKSIANLHNLPISFISGLILRLSGVAFEKGVHGGLNHIKSGLGHFEKSNFLTSAHSPLLLLAAFASMSMLYTVHLKIDSNTRPTEPVPEKISHRTGCLGVSSAINSTVALAVWSLVSSNFSDIGINLAYIKGLSCCIDFVSSYASCACCKTSWRSFLWAPDANLGAIVPKYLHPDVVSLAWLLNALLAHPLSILIIGGIL